MSKKDVLASKRRRTERYRFEVSDPSAASAAVLEAQRAVRRASNEDEQAAAEQLLKQARAELESCYGEVTLQALPARLQLQFQQEQAEADAARERAHAEAVAGAEEAGENPPADVEPEPTWDEESFEVRFIAACDADGRTPAQWARALSSDDWSLQEKNELLAVALTVNTTRRWDFSVLGKG